MNIWGLFFMLVSWGLILALVVFSFVKVLEKDNKNNNE
jgi:hypothetical protein